MSRIVSGVAALWLVFGLVSAVTCGAALAGPMEEAKALIAEHQKTPVFEPPGEVFDAKTCMAGKKVMSIPLSMTIPFEVQLTNAMKEAAKEVGFTLDVWDNQLKVDQWIQGVSQAISGKYDAIDLTGGLNAEVLVPQLTEARNERLKISTTHLYDVTQTAHPITDYSAKVDFSGAGRLLASWAYAATEGKPNVIIVGSSDILPSIPFMEAIKTQLKTYCPDCKQKVVDVPVSEWATKIQSGVQSALLADPGVNYIIPIYDSMAQFVIPALRVTGTEGAVGVAGFNGTPFILDMLREGQVQMDVGESLGWAGYAAVDNIMRMMCGHPQPAKLNVPLYVFDKTNVEKAGVPANYNDGYGDAHLTGFRKLWKLEN